MKVNGRCHCGKIAYEAEVDPASPSQPDELRPQPSIGAMPGSALAIAF